ncbi:hypothetical protein J6590_071321, partial [Homalodisca vitripennis]
MKIRKSLTLLLIYGFWYYTNDIETELDGIQQCEIDMVGGKNNELYGSVGVCVLDCNTCTQTGNGLAARESVSVSDRVNSAATTRNLGTTDN